MSDLPIQIVDENDQPTSSASQLEAQQQGLQHRIVRVMVEDEQGNILLQKRKATQRLYPNCWDPSAAGHVDAGESYEQAALRETKEEISISGFPLQELGSYRSNNTYKNLKLNRFNRLYKIVVPRDIPIKIQESEVASVQWFTLEEVRHLVAEHPDQVSDGLQEAVEKYYAPGKGRQDDGD